MSTGKKILVGIGVVAVLGVLAFLSLKPDRAGATEVRSEKVQRRDLVQKVTASGHIEAKASVDISAQIPGRIVRLPVQEGQDVKEGDLLLLIDPSQYQAQLERAQAALKQAQAGESQAEANYDQSERDWKRLDALKKATPDLVTDQEVERSRTDASVKKALLEAAKFNVSQAQASVSEAQDNLDKTRIEAPMSGRITRLNVKKGETAVVGTMNNPGSLLLTVADLSVMEAVIEVDETDVADVQVGDSAAVEIDAFPGKRFTGVVTRVGNSSMTPRSTSQSSADQAVDFEVRITLDDPPKGIRPDLSATADVVTATRKDALSIPIIALTLLEPSQVEKLPDETAPKDTLQGLQKGVEGVFVVQGDTVVFQPVKVGITGENYFEVLSGVDEGTPVVAGPYKAIRMLKPGSRVKITKPSGSPADSSEKVTTRD